MIKKYSLIRLGQEMLTSLDQTLVEAQALRENLRSSLEYYANEAEPSPQSEARLRADLMLAQDLAPRLDEASQAAGPAMAPDFGDLEKDRAVRFEIDGRWRVHELTTVLAATNTIYQLFAVRHVALPRLVRHSGRTATRSNVYDEAQLYHYLDAQEELQVGRLRYSSPGELELVSQLATHIPQVMQSTWWVLLLATIVPRALREMPSIRRHWVEENAKTELIKQRREQARLLHELFIKQVRQAVENTVPTGREPAERGLQELADALRIVTEADAVDPLRLVEKQVQAIATIARYVEQKKLRPVRSRSSKG